MTMTLTVDIHKTLGTRERRFELSVSFTGTCQRIVLFGPSGAGKSLTLQAVAGLLTPERERGTRYRSYGPTAVRDARMIVMLRQGHHPFPQIRAVLEGLRESGSVDALRAAMAQRRDFLTARSTALLEAAGRLHSYLAAVQLGFER